MTEAKDHAKATLELCKLSEKELLAMIAVELMRLNRNVKSVELELSVIKLKIR